MRRQNTAVPGTVEQGKSSYLVATVAEDLARERCAVIVLDPKGDAADAAVSLVDRSRTCTVLDFSDPTCGFNPLAVDAPADVIADYVVGALRNLFTDADIRASSDRYLRNAIIAVLAYDRRCTLWDAARLLSVGEEGYSYRARVGARMRTLPEYKEIAQFFTAELTAQLADSRSTTTAKLDAPVNKLARLLNSPSIKRVLLNESLTIDFDRVIAGGEVVVVKGALGVMGAGNTSVLMQLLVGMLDAALARQQDLVAAEDRVAVALKVDEAPLVLNRGFAETMALKRSSGLETVACWQTESQWVDREIRDQLDALFAHRVYFATASAADARASASLMMAEFSDTVRGGDIRLATLGHPDARLHLPKHHAIASWTTAEGRQSPFVARTLPFSSDPQRLAFHRERQAARGGRRLEDLRQPHWEKMDPSTRDGDHPHREAEAVEPASADPPEGRAGSSEPQPAAPDDEIASTSADTYRELVDIDRAAQVRRVAVTNEPRPLAPEMLDIEMLSLIARMRHVLTTQIHRCLNPGRAATTTQRRLKRLSDAGLVGRLRFHGRDGGGAPICYTVTTRGLQLLHHHGRLTEIGEQDLPTTDPEPASIAVARRDLHATAWALALEHLLGDGCRIVAGPTESALSPPTRSTSQGRLVTGPADLRLGSGMIPHDFLTTDPAGRRTALERFQTIRPQLTIAVAQPRGEVAATVTSGSISARLDILVELLGSRSSARLVASLERYDHFLCGWYETVKRYRNTREDSPRVVFVCRDRTQARESARRADAVLTACRAYAGEYPSRWLYLGRDSIVFVAERDVHEGRLLAYGLQALPPQVRVDAAGNDPNAMAALPVKRTIV